MTPVPRAASQLRGRVAGSVRVGAEGALRGGIDQLVRRNLRGVWVAGELPTGPCVWAANHHSWWDFFVAAAALRAAGRRDVGVLMEAGNVGRQSLFESVGAVGTDQLRTAVEMLRDGLVLVVFPEGELRPAGPVGPVRPGARWLADRSGASLRAVATRVLLRGQQAPEGYLRVSAPLTPDDDLGRALADGVAGLDAALAAADPMQALPGFRAAVTGVRSWNERFAALRGGR
ncbi:lysophospholipid acyltransferase family protein [Nakamurella deserti]|uniref:lysophospholipid acyltransferase family protein n=1 Tax=Nakamurella deserti TaxID=2164074 RepID=UPI000DBE24D5|nr:1-acyl-sn-glycerol-3-phosphate acyltransferase [Nakamurella deserti]